MKKKLVLIIVPIVLLITITLVYTYNNIDLEKEKYFDDLSLVDYEADSYSYRSFSHSDNEYYYNQLTGYITLYQAEELQTVDLITDTIKGAVIIIKISEDLSYQEVSSSTNSVTLLPGDKIKVVAKRSTMNVTITPVE